MPQVSTDDPCHNMTAFGMTNYQHLSRPRLGRDRLYDSQCIFGSDHLRLLFVIGWGARAVLDFFEEAHLLLACHARRELKRLHTLLFYDGEVELAPPWEDEVLEDRRAMK